MAELFENKGNRYPLRLNNWDYRWAGTYFITICTYNRAHFFGKISDGKMELSNVGVIADLLWFEIKNHFENVELGEFVVMPNHIHGILKLTKFKITEHSPSAKNFKQPKKNIAQQRYQNIGQQSISSIVLAYKSSVKRHTNRLNYDFRWQTRFHDRILRDEQSIEAVTNYIKNNPKNWKEADHFEL